jgi:Rrf2 family protein
MKLSRRTDYALRAMTYLALRKGDGQSSIAEISEAESIPREFSAKVLKELCRAGFIRSRLGPRGGYRLVKSPQELTVLEIIEALDGPLSISDCIDDPEFCGRSGACRMHQLFGRVNEQMKHILGSATLADIAGRDQTAEPVEDAPPKPPAVEPVSPDLRNTIPPVRETFD